MAGGCRQSSDVVSSSLLSKRKYRAGWHSDLFGPRENIPREKFLTADKREPQTGRHEVSGYPGDSSESLSIVPISDPGLPPTVADNVTGAREKTLPAPEKTKTRKKITTPQWLQRPMPAAEEDPYAERMEFMGLVSLGIAGAVFTFAWIIPLLNILLCLAGIVFGIIAFAGGETLNGALGIAANFLLLIWSVIWTFIILSPFLLI